MTDFAGDEPQTARAHHGGHAEQSEGAESKSPSSHHAAQECLLAIVCGGAALPGLDRIPLHAAPVRDAPAWPRARLYDSPSLVFEPPPPRALV